MIDVDPSVHHSRRRDELQVRELVEGGSRELGPLAHRAYNLILFQALHQFVLILHRRVEHGDVQARP